jgi:hypothetical protein
MASWIETLMERINRAFESRLERASGLSESHAQAEAAGEGEEEDVEIVNLPRGAKISE